MPILNFSELRDQQNEILYQPIDVSAIIPAAIIMVVKSASAAAGAKKDMR